MKRYDFLGEDDAPREYRRRCITKNKAVKVIRSGSVDAPRDAFCEEILDNFHLVVRYNDGTREELSSGEVSVKI